MTADVPKRARVAGGGFVMLGKLSGRPIVPTAAVMSRRVQFNTGDRGPSDCPSGAQSSSSATSSCFAERR